MKRWYILVAILLVFPFKLIGQATVPGQGINPGRDYLQSPIDTIDTSSGALNLKIPIVSYKQRGSLPDFGLSLTYNNVVWVNVVTPYFGENVMDCGVTPCNALENYWIPNNLGISVQRDNALAWASMVFPPQQANTTDELAIYAIADDTRATHLFYGQQGGGINGARTTDGSGLQIHVLSPLPGDHIAVTDGNGITHSGAFDQILLGSDDAWTDPDGNSVTPYMDGSSTLYWVDSVGRTIPVPATFEPTNGVPDTPPACFTTQFPAVNGGTAPYTFCYSSVPVNEIAVPVPNILYQYSGSPTMLSSLTLPDGTSYTFTYNLTGDLAQVTLPQGGTIKYTWTTAPTNVDNGTVFQRAVQTRTLNAGNNAPDQVWTFAYTVGGATITDPMGNDSVYAYSPPNGSSGSSVGYNTIVHYQGTKSGNHVLSTITKCLQLNGTDVYEFAYPYAIPSTLSCGVTTTINDGSTSQVLTGYDPVQSLGDPLNQYDTYIASMNLGMPVSTTETDYGAGTPGPVLKTTNTEYEWQANSNYLSANLMALPHSTSVTDGSGHQIAQTTYEYDENNGSPQGTYGHNTSTQSWLNTTGGTAQTSTVYNSQGMPTQQIDANLNVTAITGYQCSGLLPQTVVSAYQSTTTMPETISYVYDCNTSQATAITDPNSVTTQYVYDDPLGRITQVKTAVGTSAENWTAYTYPSATQINVVQDEVTKGDGLLHKSSVYDGLGQVIHYTAPNGATTDTGYDLAGRIQSVSNPHLSTASATDGTTTFAYDGLGRKTLQTQPNGSTQKWLYNGNVTTFTDEASHSWLRTSDALGRLTNIMEPTGAQTIYTYNALNNLLSVNQKGVSGETPRNRSFNYDSLSRLHCASNPENSQNPCPTSATSTLPSGVTSYIYDANSNLTSNTDARGIMISYSYDALNRMTAKSSSGASGVPGFNYSYLYDDTTHTNGIGRLTHSSNDVNGAEDYFYDPVGRLDKETYCIPDDCSYGTQVGATYDLAGNIMSLTYPDGRTVSQQWNSAGQLTQVSDVSGQYQYLTPSTAYWPNGTPQSVFYGNGVANGIHLNQRLQADEIGMVRIGSVAPGSYPANNPLSVKEYCFGPATSALSSTIPGCPSRGSANSGNIWQVMDVLHSGYTENLSYDSLNRLDSFSRVDGSLSQTYAYDSFGNLNQTSPGTLQNKVSYGANNRINSASYGYDNAGNLTASFNGISTAYNYDAENMLTSVNNGAANYTYDANGDRVRKDTNSNWTEYVRFGGQVVAEKTSDGFWSDYIYANGKRIAKVDNSDIRIHMSGTNCSGCGSINTFAGTSSLAGVVNGTVIQNGDLLTWRQFQDGVAAGGIDVAFNNNTVFTTGVLRAADGQLADDDTRTGTGLWYQRVADLSSYAGDTVSNLTLYNFQGGAAGNWDIYFADISLVHPDGTVVPIYYRSVESLAQFNSGAAESNVTVVTEKVAVIPNLYNVTYYSADQVGSSILLTDSAGWPVSSDTYYPFGQEPTPSADGNHYKFTGQERDSESGLDYFGARYYGSSMGRFMSPDWAPKATPIPFATLDNPQSLNLYSYVGNNPLSRLDADGHQQKCTTTSSVTYSTDANGELQATNNFTTTCHEESDGFWGGLGGIFIALNPWGKLGGPAHRATVNKIAEIIQREGFEVQKEVPIKTPNGWKGTRYVDVVGHNKETGETKMYQVGASNKDGTPVSREVRALDDIQDATGMRPQFEDKGLAGRLDSIGSFSMQGESSESDGPMEDGSIEPEIPIIE
jgi:RHS repeat-associated protein